ncbi:MAG TPA: aminotransferase class I/II-fold pyridoxal phosphate-dependent enzyme [Bacteroidia bacterium]|nr:aminotransferase class I/II-fold pyridoxal phosphate-dependent enzyme [Bacteroidia bacterium]
MQTSIELKSKHEQMLDTIGLIIEKLIPLGITHQHTEDEVFNGRTVRIKGNDMVNFSSCSYLGLEMDQRLKDGAIDAINRYGTYFSSSRAYLTTGLYEEIEDLLTRIFERPILLATSTMLGHVSNIPVLVGDRDAVILDHNVHASVTTCVEILKGRQIPVEMIRHSNMDMLEEKIKKYAGSHEKVWYFADGVYSMHGDLLPVKDVYTLLDKYENFYLYADDVHGMGWTGKNGAGSVAAQAPFHEKLYLATGLSKSFAAFGGVLAYPNEQMKKIVKYFGKTMTFCAPVQPPNLGAAVASAKIHLSGEIYSLQAKLQHKIKLFNSLAKLYDLPLYSDAMTPVKFICLGKPETGYAMVRQLMDRGFYVSISCYPSVPYNNTGIRVPVTLHHTDEDIENIVKTIAELLPATLKVTDSNIHDVYRSFKMKVTSRT